MSTETLKATDNKISAPVRQGNGSPFFQPKLTINQPGDEYEREADATAEQVMRMTANSFFTGESSKDTFFKPATISVAAVQKKCGDSEEEKLQRKEKEDQEEETVVSRKAIFDFPVQRKCAHCEEEEEKKMQRKETNSSETAADISTENYISSLNGKGSSLTSNERKFFEPRMGYDFSAVQLHTNEEANQSAKSINALAYTHGNNIVFGSGQYQPDTDEGKKLMTHELTHVVQQTGTLQTKLIQRANIHPPRRTDCSTLDDYIRLIVVNQETPQTVTIFWNYSGATETATCSTGKGGCCIDDAADDNIVGADQTSSVTGNSNWTPIGNKPVKKIINLGANDIRRYWTEFDDPRDIALHAYPRFDGTPLSHGCVRMGEDMANKIYCGSIVDRTQVEVRGFARPRCATPALQNEWFLDFSEAATPLDGQPPDLRRAIISTRRMLKRFLNLGDNARGEAALDTTLQNLIDPSTQRISLQNVKAAIPRCSDISGLGVEEERLQRVDQPQLNQTFINDFRIQLGAVTSLSAATTLIQTKGLELWNQSHATTNAQNQLQVDDRTLYWTRNFVIREINEWNPLFGVTTTQKGGLIQNFESASRGLTQTTFTADPGVKKILITGFDPFGLRGTGIITEGNPSGAVVLGLDGQTISGANCNALIRGAVFPVRYNDFDQGIVENFVSNFLVGGNQVDMIMTISQGQVGVNPTLPAGYELERWAGRARRSGIADNSGTPSTQADLNQSLTTRYGASGRNDEFIESTLPVNSMIANNAAVPDGSYKARTSSGALIDQTTSLTPPSGSTAVEGSGGDFLSNEVFYRTRLLQINQSPPNTIPMGHLHIPGRTPADYPVIITMVRTILTNALNNLCPHA